LRLKTPQQAEKILAAAAELFATHRFHEARMDDIAALAEVSKGTLYRYFPDKEELYLALLDRAAEGLQARLCQELRRADAPPRQLVAVVAGLIDYFDAQPHLFDLIQHAEVMQRPGTGFPWQKTRDKTIGLVKGILAADELGIGQPDLAVLMLLGGLRAVIRFGPRPRPAGLADEIVRRFLDGFRAGRGPEGRAGEPA
jgi:AcrR family transcriptional regulator